MSHAEHASAFWVLMGPGCMVNGGLCWENSRLAGRSVSRVISDLGWLVSSLPALPRLALKGGGLRPPLSGSPPGSNRPSPAAPMLSAALSPVGDGRDTGPGLGPDCRVVVMQTNSHH